MKNLLNTILESQYDGETIYPKDIDFIVINTDDKIIEYHKESDVKNNKDYFGEATSKVLELKPMQSFEDSVNVYIRIK